MQDLNSIKEGNIIEINFLMSGNHITYRRTYQKIDEYLSEITGYLGNIILLVWMISWI